MSPKTYCVQITLKTSVPMSQIIKSIESQILFPYGLANNYQIRDILTFFLLQGRFLCYLDNRVGELIRKKVQIK